MILNGLFFNFFLALPIFLGLVFFLLKKDGTSFIDLSKLLALETESDSMKIKEPNCTFRIYLQLKP